ncbi:hypothetical protein JX265_001642 [Neoarthrinium moseri]|uniref:Xylanolytic transcriptional activator regulatory domain-containing protein n=1 Tax=Neoarthrinium moseri TaxID=1658444 RepID=A0A9Q0AVA4_9PEZI|nr:hypothetical protein JX265_001642 [Neoarthrinium moseri]
MLRSLGAKVEPGDELDDSGSQTPSQPDIDVHEDIRDHLPSRIEGSTPKLVTTEGTSRYFDSAPWANLGAEFQHPEVEGLGEPMNKSTVDEGELFFEPEQTHAPGNLADLHPPFQLLLKLKEVYIDRVDALVKIVHVPSFWSTLMNRLQHPQGLPKSLEALAFAVYFAAISSLSDKECQDIFEASRSALVSRYRIATRQALVNAEFLSTYSPNTLRAFAIFTICMRDTYRLDTLYALSGLSIRLARKMGLHRDGASLGLSPFETEMRRRLWWHLVHVDFRTADVLGTRPSLDLSSGDAKMPWNVNDEDLQPDMTELPPERNAITSIALCLLKTELWEALRQFSSLTYPPGDVRWEAVGSTDVSVARKDSFINQLEDRLESRYLRYCDPSDSLHAFVSAMARTAICKMRLFAHSPRQFAQNPGAVAQSDRDIAFANATKLLEYVTWLKAGRHDMGKYMWQIGTSHLWNTMLYVLIEARHCKTGPQVEKTWQLIGKVFSHYPQVFEESTGAVYKALGKWTLDVWQEYVEALNSEDLPLPQTPRYIAALRRCRDPTRESGSGVRNNTMEASGLQEKSVEKIPALGWKDEVTYDGLLPDWASFESYEIPELLSFEMDPNEWIQWEQLVAGHGSHTQVSSL